MTSLYSEVVKNEVKMITSALARNTNDFRGTFFDAFEGKISLPGETKSVFFILKKAILSKNEQYGFWLSVAGFGNGLL